MSAEDVIKCEERYNKSKTVHSIMRHVAEKSAVDMEVVNEMVAWPLYRKWGHAFEAFKVSITYASVVLRPHSPASPIDMLKLYSVNRNPSSASSRSRKTSWTTCAPTSRAG